LSSLDHGVHARAFHARKLNEPSVTAACSQRNDCSFPGDSDTGQKYWIMSKS
jgi:hypothetical protein